MITIKCFESFLIEQAEDDPVVFNYNDANPEPKSWNFDDADSTFNFVFQGVGETKYTLKVYHDFEVFVVSFPDGSFKSCSYSALKRIDYFRNFERGFLHKWLLRTILYIEYKGLVEITDWTTLDNPNITTSVK